MIYVLIPVYNEEKNIENLANELKNLISDQNIFLVFSDDGSNDKSLTFIAEYFKNQSFKIISDGVNRGPGAAFNKGFEWILSDSKSDKDIIVTLEADCTSDIDLLPKMLAINNLGFDLVLASVYAQGGGFDDTTFLRRFLSSVANLMYRFLFKVNVLTLSSFYRVYSISILKKIKSKYDKIITENGFICMLEILLKGINCKASIIEVPMILQSKKRIGKSKMKLLKTSFQYLKFLWNFNRNPK